MRRIFHLIPVLTVLVVSLGMAMACGLKGPPIPPEAKGKQPEARSGSGVMQFGPKEQKEAPEEDLILKLYGPEKPAKTHLPGIEENFGTGGMGNTSKPPETWIEKQREIEEEGTPTPTPTPTPAPAPTPAPTPGQEPQPTPAGEPPK